MVLGAIVCFAIAAHFNSAVRRDAWMVVGAPLQLCFWFAGRSLGVAALLARPVVRGIYELGSLWYQPLANVSWSWWQSMVNYCDKRQFYRPQHAA